MSGGLAASLGETWGSFWFLELQRIWSPVLLGLVCLFFLAGHFWGQVPGSCVPSTRFLLCPFFFAGHKDSVTCAGFSHDSTLVATGDMSGLLKVWQVDTKEELWSFEAGDLEVSSSEWNSLCGTLGRDESFRGSVPPLLH